MSGSIAVGSDHRGFAIKQALVRELEHRSIPVDDKGADSNRSADYPVYAGRVARAVSRGESERGILICGSGIGMSVTANKFPGVRAALCHDTHAAEMCRRHNNSNVLVLGEGVGEQGALELLRVWLETPFEGGRHQKRLDLIAEIERDNFKTDPKVP